MNTAAADAPAVMPMMSGLASGLRARDWKIAPRTRTPRRRAPRSAPGQPQRADDEVGVGVAVAEHRRHDVAQRDREVADARSRRRRPRAVATASTIDTDDRPGAARRADPARRRPVASAARRRRRRLGRASPVDGHGSELGQLAAAHQRDEERRADQRGDDADLELAGPGDDPADDVGAEQQDRREHRRVRQDPAVVGPGDRPGDVRHGQPDERDRAGRRRRPRRRAAPPTTAENSRGQARPAGRASGRRRRRAPARSAADPTASAITVPTTMNGATCAAIVGVRARPASRPPRSGTGRASRRRSAGSPW